MIYCVNVNKFVMYNLWSINCIDHLWILYTLVSLHQTWETQVRKQTDGKMRSAFLCEQYFKAIKADFKLKCWFIPSYLFYSTHDEVYNSWLVSLIIVLWCGMQSTFSSLNMNYCWWCKYMVAIKTVSLFALMSATEFPQSLKVTSNMDNNSCLHLFPQLLNKTKSCGLTKINIQNCQWVVNRSYSIIYWLNIMRDLYSPSQFQSSLEGTNLLYLWKYDIYI